jgi:uncharacterized glyoxalase superfamily metalloenzyme YdcJ
MAGSWIGTTELRQRLSERLSALYGSEVPAYTTLLDVAHEVNLEVLHHQGADAERLGSIARVTAERHGAIRVGSERELAEVAQVFAGFGMLPTGFYDLRESSPVPVPVVSTAFRPTDPTELAVNPFRVFTSMLVRDDRRFFDRDLTRRLTNFLERRRLFHPDLLVLAERAEGERELPADLGERLVDLTAEAFALTDEPVDRGWYAELETVSSVAADIHLLLRQTSFRALAEPRRFREPDGRIERGELRVRFGEVEKRGIAPTATGHALYEELLREADSMLARGLCPARHEAMVHVWRERLPDTEQGLFDADLGYFTFEPTAGGIGSPLALTLPQLVTQRWVKAAPIVYEDFLPRSAAGIFASNLTGAGRVDDVDGGAPRDQAWMSGVIGREVIDPHDLYGEQRRASVARVAAAFDLDPALMTFPDTSAESPETGSESGGSR